MLLYWHWADKSVYNILSILYNNKKIYNILFCFTINFIILYNILGTKIYYPHIPHESQLTCYSTRAVERQLVIADSFNNFAGFRELRTGTQYYCSWYSWWRHSPHYRARMNDLVVLRSLKVRCAHEEVLPGSNFV